MNTNFFALQSGISHGQNIYLKIKAFFLVFFILFMAFSCKKDENTSTTPPIEKDGTYLQTAGTFSREGRTYNSTTGDLSAVKVTGGTLNISQSKISSSGNTTSIDSSNVYGLNAVMLAYSGTEIFSTNNTISSTGTGATGIHTYQSVGTTTGDKLNISGDYSHAIMVDMAGSVTVTNDTAVTSGTNASTIAVDSATINLEGGVYTANGSNSAAIYSKGIIVCTKATLKSNGAEALITDGSHKITLNYCTVTGAYNKRGAMIYNSSNSNTSITDGYIILINGSFTYSGTKGGTFYNTNSRGYFTLDSVTISSSCDTLVKSVKGSWNGFSAPEGGQTFLTTKKVTLSGLVYADANSTVYVTLLKSSVYTGAINNGNTALLASLTMDASSTWSLTDDSYINGLIVNPGISGTSVSNITGNGHNIYYLKSANSDLKDATYNLVNGGQLIPQ